MPELFQRLTDALSSRYRIVRELGRGGMATVFLAEDLRHQRRVAVKVLDPEVAATIGPEHFLREIATLAQFTHPHILPLHDSGIADGLLFYVMPYVEGESLRRRLTREKQLPVEDALRIAREVADALSYAHGCGVVHRDIKPENILLESGHAVVADFGIARAVFAAGGEKLTATGIAVGTPAYMSPEQATGSRDLDGRSDLYSLACVLYEMLAGQPPFTGPTVESLAHQHLNVTPRSVTELRPAVPATVAAALQRALAKAPADRFNPVALFSEALAHRDALPVPMIPAGPPAVPTPLPRRAPRRLALAGFVAAGIVLAVAAAWWLTLGRGVKPPVQSPSPGYARSEIAVLPFQNLSSGGPHAYFASGLHDELLTQLAKISALKVISRTSVMGYEGARKPLKTIAAELGVGSVVEGTVQVEGQRLRVTVQLIDAATDEHVWAESYDRTLDDAFAIQSDIAQRIVTAVGAALSGSERLAIAETPTASPEAYRLYLQGEEYRRPGYTRENYESAQQLFERAILLDPKFALAHAALSIVHGSMYWSTYDPTPARADRQRAEAGIALRLAPNLPQGHVAMGLAHYWGRRDYRRALDEFRIALRAMPNNAEVWSYVGFANRRLGNWAAVDTAYRAAVRLDPRNAGYFWDLGGITFAATRRHAEAIRAYDRALTLAPNLRNVAIRRAWAYVGWKGDLNPLRSVLDAMPRDQDLGEFGTATSQRARLLLLERKPRDLISLARGVSGGGFHGHDLFVPASFAAWGYRALGQEDSARMSLRTELATLDTLSDSGVSDGWKVHAHRGSALAALGRRREALEEVRWLGRCAASRDAFGGALVAMAQAEILAQSGQPDAALDRIERLLAGPSDLTVPFLRLEPRWDPIRGNPRFRALLVKYADPEKSAVR